jgi:hypothetical protein
VLLTETRRSSENRLAPVSGVLCLGPTGVPQPLMTAAIIAVPDWCPASQCKLPTQNPSFRVLNHENVNRCTRPDEFHYGRTIKSPNATHYSLMQLICIRHSPACQPDYS